MQYKWLFFIFILFIECKSSSTQNLSVNAFTLELLKDCKEKRYDKVLSYFDENYKPNSNYLVVTVDSICSFINSYNITDSAKFVAKRVKDTTVVQIQFGPKIDDKMANCEVFLYFINKNETLKLYKFLAINRFEVGSYTSEEIINQSLSKKPLEGFNFNSSMVYDVFTFYTSKSSATPIVEGCSSGCDNTITIEDLPDNNKLPKLIKDIIDELNSTKIDSILEFALLDYNFPTNTEFMVLRFNLGIDFEYSGRITIATTLSNNNNIDGNSGIIKLEYEDNVYYLTKTTKIEDYFKSILLLVAEASKFSK